MEEKNVRKGNTTKKTSKQNVNRKTPKKSAVKSKKKKSGKKRKSILKILIVLFLIFAIAAASGNIYYKVASKAVDPKSKAGIFVEIPNGSSAKKVAAILKENGLIRNERVFVSNLKETEKSNMVKAGKYRFSKSMDNKGIIDMLIEGKTVKDGIKVTIPEGSISTYIVDLLVKKNLGDRDKFVKLFRSPEQFSDEYKFLKDPDIKTLEGFMYPQTYYFKKDMGEKQILSMMLDQFEKAYNSKARSLVKKNKLDFYNTVIMASIVEKEAVKDKDRPIIAGIFYNRLDKNMKLQSDAVLQYGLPSRKGRVLYSDLKVDSPYNLYIHKGLPPTPICNPGIKSLVAAAEPTKTDYLYFVTNVNGENSYSKTFKEHKVHADKYREEKYGDIDKANKEKNDKKDTDKVDN